MIAMDGERETGHIRERELYEALVRRFGEDCVYLNSKYKRPDGAEKELWDIFVLALPYAVVFQMKWRDRSANDFVGERGCVEAKRLDKKMSEAAKQFREFLTLYDNHATIRLPRVWRQQSGDYELPLDFIEKIIPVVVIDFDDPDYANPDLRMCLRPRVSDVSNRVKPFGTVHSFLFKDLLRIIDQMFTIGDLVTYLMKRREMLETGVAFVQYSEMDMFALYQTDYPLWEKLVGNSAVVIEPGIFEAKTAKHKEKFAQRQQFFTTPDLIDGLIDEVVHSDVEDMACLQNLGRLRLMTSVMKKDVSKVLMQNIRLFSLPRDAQVCGMRRSIGNYASEIMPGTYICVVVFNGMPSHMIAVASYCYLRTLRRIEELQKKGEAKEVFIIMVSAITPASYVELKQILDEDYGLAPSQEEIEASRFDCSERKVKASEWGYLEDNRVRGLE